MGWPLSFLTYVIRKSNINTDGTLIYKSIQIAVYADDINIMARTQQNLKNIHTSRTKRKEGWSTDKYYKK
jgi:hypothetical protein